MNMIESTELYTLNEWISSNKSIFFNYTEVLTYYADRNPTSLTTFSSGKAVGKEALFHNADGNVNDTTPMEGDLVINSLKIAYSFTFDPAVQLLDCIPKIHWQKYELIYAQDISYSIIYISNIMAIPQIIHQWRLVK